MVMARNPEFESCEAQALDWRHQVGLSLGRQVRLNGDVRHGLWWPWWGCCRLASHETLHEQPSFPRARWRVCLTPDRTYHRPKSIPATRAETFLQPCRGPGVAAGHEQGPSGQRGPGVYGLCVALQWLPQFEKLSGDTDMEVGLSPGQPWQLPLRDISWTKALRSMS